MTTTSHKYQYNIKRIKYSNTTLQSHVGGTIQSYNFKYLRSCMPWEDNHHLQIKYSHVHVRISEIGVLQTIWKKPHKIKKAKERRYSVSNSLLLNIEFVHYIQKYPTVLSLTFMCHKHNTCSSPIGKHITFSLHQVLPVCTQHTRSS